MSESECEYYQPAVITEKKTKSNRKPSADNNGKSKVRSTSSSLTRTSKQTKTVTDVFGITRSHEPDTESNADAPKSLSSFIVNRVANGSERRMANTDGEFYIDCKVYKTSDAHNTDSLELWKKALVRLKFQSNMDSPQWRKLQEFVRSVDSLFVEQPTKFKE